MWARAGGRAGESEGGGGRAGGACVRQRYRSPTQAWSPRARPQLTHAPAHSAPPPALQSRIHHAHPGKRNQTQSRLADNLGEGSCGAVESDLYSRERRKAIHSSHVAHSTGRRPCLSLVAACVKDGMTISSEEIRARSCIDLLGNYECQKVQCSELAIFSRCVHWRRTVHVAFCQQRGVFFGQYNQHTLLSG